MVKDPSVYVKVKAADGDFSYLVWTTTPWTLPSNAALCMRPDADYVMVEHEGEKLVLAEALGRKVFGEEKSAAREAQRGGFCQAEIYPAVRYRSRIEADKAFYLINGEFVTLEDGTGIVHIAPGYGADDYEIGLSVRTCRCFRRSRRTASSSEGTGAYAGMFIKDADPIIIKDLKIAGQLFKKEIYEHNYPFCWRCDSPLIYIARQSPGISGPPSSASS